jgi:hypothetical protein
LTFLAVAGAVVLAIGLSQSDDDSSSDASDTYASSSPYTPEPYTPEPYDPSTEDPYGSEPTASEEPPDPFTTGTCLNGELPDSTTAQEVSVDEVDCSAADAHYQVIETIPFTSDMSRCDDNPRTQYAYNYRYTWNGTTINEYVYCLIGLGAYAR